MSPSIYKHTAANAVLWHDIMRWIIEQVEVIDFDELGKVKQGQERPCVEYRGEA
jgi:hypothetical protein